MIKRTLLASSVLALMSTTTVTANPMPLLQQKAPAQHNPSINKLTKPTHKHQKRDHGVDQAEHSAFSPLSASSHFKPRKSKGASQLSSAAATVCDSSALAAASAQTIVAEITSQGTECVNRLFSDSSDIQRAAFNSEKMIAVANATVPRSTTYQGNGDAAIEAMFLYLRAGYFAAFYDDGLSFSADVTPAVKVAIDAFVANSHFYNNNEGHGMVLREVMSTMDSSEQQHVYLPVVKQWFSRWNADYAATWSMRSAVNNIFWILTRGKQNPAYVDLVKDDTALMNELRDFALDSWMLDSDAEFMMVNAGMILGQYKALTGTAIQPTVDAGLKTLFATYEKYGRGDAIWLAAANATVYYTDCEPFRHLRL